MIPTMVAVTASNVATAGGREYRIYRSNAPDARIPTGIRARLFGGGPRTGRRIMNVSIVGLGKLGACMAVCAADKGHNVIGVDINLRTLDAINERRPHIDETDYDFYLKKCGAASPIATPSTEEAVLNSDITFIVVPTPSEYDGSYSLKYVADALESIGEALAIKDSYHLIVLVSTVLPGASRYGLLSKLAASCPDKEVGKDYGFCYSPEFIALGSVIRDMKNPETVLIGEFDKRSGYTLLGFYSEFYDNAPYIHRMSIENAELAKIALNTYLTVKITFMNMLGMICEELPGGNVDHVTDALGDDARVGPKLLKAGLGYGGPCLPRDNRALDFLCQQLDIGYTLPRSIDDINKIIPESIVNIIGNFDLLGGLKGSESVLVCGLAYKLGTPITEESQAVEIANMLHDRGVSVSVTDFETSPAHLQSLSDGINFHATIDIGLDHFDAIIIATADERWRDLDPLDLKDGVLVVDCWRIMGHDFAASERINYRALGIGDLDLFRTNLRPLWEMRV